MPKHLKHHLNLTKRLGEVTEITLKYRGEIIETPDAKAWMYNPTRHEWVEVTRPKKLVTVPLT